MWRRFPGEQNGHNSSKIAWNTGLNYFTNHSDEQMSSYQFVNSLTSCYGQVPRGGPDSGASSLPSGDYYTPQAYNNCYNTSSNVTGTAQPSSPAYSAYLQQNGDHHHAHSHVSSAHHHPYSSNSCSQAAVAAVAAAQSRLSHHSGPQVLPSKTTSPSSCKYAIDSASSPQDLSTSSGGAGQSPEPRSITPQSQTRTGGQGNNHAGQQGNTGTQASGQQSQGKNGNYSSGSNPPHIYPWMRKVHVGQSKSKLNLHFQIEFI